MITEIDEAVARQRHPAAFAIINAKAQQAAREHRSELTIVGYFVFSDAQATTLRALVADRNECEAWAERVRGDASATIANPKSFLIEAPTRLAHVA